MTFIADIQEETETKQREPLIGWLEYDQSQIKTILGKRRPLLNQARFNLEKRKASGIFSLSNVPHRRRKKFKAITEIHYHTSCNELAMFLLGALTYRKEPSISEYLTFDDFIIARNGYQFHKARIGRMDMAMKHRPEETFSVEMELLRTKRMNGQVYAKMEVRGDLKGRLLYSYTPQAL